MTSNNGHRLNGSEEKQRRLQRQAFAIKLASLKRGGDPLARLRESAIQGKATPERLRKDLGNCSLDELYTTLKEIIPQMFRLRYPNKERG